MILTFGFNKFNHKSWNTRQRFFKLKRIKIKALDFLSIFVQYYAKEAESALFGYKF